MVDFSHDVRDKGCSGETDDKQSYFNKSKQSIKHETLSHKNKALSHKHIKTHINMR